MHFLLFVLMGFGRIFFTQAMWVSVFLGWALVCVFIAYRMLHHSTFNLFYECCRSVDAEFPLLVMLTYFLFSCDRLMRVAHGGGKICWIGELLLLIVGELIVVVLYGLPAFFAAMEFGGGI